MNRINQALVTGCSYASGYGLRLEKDDPDMWANKLLLLIGANRIDNFAMSGSSNESIFHNTLACLLKTEYDLVIVAWTSIPRYNFHVGLELYHKEQRLSPGGGSAFDINCNVKTFKKKWVKKLINNLDQMHNDHWDYVRLIQYVNTLIHIQTTRNQKIFFVNSLLPHSENYFMYKDITLPSELSDYNQKLLNVDSRDDEEVFALYNMIHEHYRNYGGIQENFWLNLDQGSGTLQIDPISKDDPHPAYNSQEKFVEYLTPILKEKLKLN